jgi:elongation factor Ts
MAEKITAAMVKELREKTGAGMMDCKKALAEAEGNSEQAEIILKKKGLQKAEKSASRTAAEGKITIAKNADSVVMLETNCETDFVGRDENFNGFIEKVANAALENKVNDIEALNALTIDGQTVDQARKTLVAKIGENIQLRRVIFITKEEGQVIGSYSHQGRIGCIVILQGGDEALGKDISMHVAAMKPQYISPTHVPEEIFSKEKEIFMDRARTSGKPENMLDKIVTGQLNKHFNELTLVGQPFFKDPDLSIGALLKKNNAEVKSYVRFEVGEGIEVKKMSFQEEVMAQAKGS